MGIAIAGCMMPCACIARVHCAIMCVYVCIGQRVGSIAVAFALAGLGRVGRCFRSQPRPMAVVHGDHAAQQLSARLNELDIHLRSKFQEAFFNEERRSFIMSLPTECGEDVFEAVKLIAVAMPTAMELEAKLREFCWGKWQALAQHLLARATPATFVCGARLELPDSLSEVPAWYARQYAERIEEVRTQLMEATTDPERNVAQTWRKGDAEKHFGISGFVLYPGTPHPPRSKKSKRVGAEADKVQPGDLCTGPEDMHLKRRRVLALEEPGLLAGSSVTDNLPVLSGGCHTQAASNYAWAPLVVRVDIDRVYQNLTDSNMFRNVTATGSLGSRFKVNPWSHMNPYKVSVTSVTTGKRYIVGVTDDTSSDIARPSSSGARLYVEGSPDGLREALCQVESKHIGNQLQYAASWHLFSDAQHV